MNLKDTRSMMSQVVRCSVLVFSPNHPRLICAGLFYFNLSGNFVRQMYLGNKLTNIATRLFSYRSPSGRGFGIIW